MDDARWLACANPHPMIEAIRGRVSERKLRLFACACVAEALPHAKLVDDARQVLPEIEAFADGRATRADLRRVRQRLDAAMRSTPPVRETADDFVLEAFRRAATERQFLGAVRYVGSFVAGWGPVTLSPTPQADLLREVVGNPFRPTAFDPRWRTADVVGLARAIYEDRAFDRMPLLADALMDAGCDSDEILSHCRSAGPHVRGCWVVDLVLGQE